MRQRCGPAAPLRGTGAVPRTNAPVAPACGAGSDTVLILCVTAVEPWAVPDEQSAAPPRRELINRRYVQIYIDGVR